MVKAQRGDFALAISGTGGFSDLTVTRRVLLPAGIQSAVGQQKQQFASVTARASYRFGDDAHYVRPMVDINATRLHTSAFTETGVGALGLTAPSQTQNSVTVSPKLEFGGETVRGDLAFRPYARIGVTQILKGEDPLFRAAFIGAPTSAGRFAVTGHNDGLTKDAEVGVQIVNSKGVSAKVSWTGRFGDRTDSQGVGLKVTMPF